MKRSKWMILAAAMLVLAMVVAGCGGGAEEKKEGDKAPEGTAEKQSITIAGSTSVQPLSDELAKAFQEKNPNVTVNVQGGGSSQGVKAASEGICEIGASSRKLKDSEGSLGLVTHQIAIDGIAVVVNPKNALTDLTADQAKKIFAGEITNWKEVGGADAAINVVTREAGSGTRGAFEEMVMGEEAKITDKAVTQASNGSVRQTVAGDANAIGYLSLGFLNEEVKGVKYDGVEPTVDNVKAGTYKVSRPFLYLTKGEPSGAAKDYIDFVLGPDGQKIVGEDYITVK